MVNDTPITVLLVDDDPLVLAATSRFLGRRGLRTLCADSPFGVTALIRKESPDVVVLDCNMPGLDGTQLVRCIRSSPRTAATPVVFYSGDCDSSLAALAQSLGAHYVMKSSGPALLRTVILEAARPSGTRFAHAG